MAGKRILVADADDAACIALAELGYEVVAIPPAAVELANRLSPFRTLAEGLRHLIANPLTVIVTNGAMMAEDLAALRDLAAPDSELRADIEHLIAAQADVTVAAATIQEVVRSLA